MKTLQLLNRLYRRTFAAGAVLAAGLLLCALATPLAAQNTQNPDNNDDNIYGDNPGANNNSRNPNSQPQYNGGNNNNANYNSANDGASAGGNWREFNTEDKMTAAKRVQFELVANNAVRDNRNRDGQSRVDIFCEDGKYKSAQFVPGVRLAPPNRPGFWGQPQMEVMVRVDGTHDNHGWNWDGHYLSMDKSTVREMLGANVFNVEFLSPSGPQISEFVPTGLEVGRVQKACGLSPKKP